MVDARQKLNTGIMKELRKVTVVVEGGKDGFSCFMSGADDLDYAAFGTGKTVRACIKDFHDGISELRDCAQSRGEDFPEMEFEFVLDIGAFFDYYPINVSAFAEYIGMNKSLLRQYAAGIKEPRKSNLEKIRSGIGKLRAELRESALVEHPVLGYV